MKFKPLVALCAAITLIALVFGFTPAPISDGSGGSAELTLTPATTPALEKAPGHSQLDVVGAAAPQKYRTAGTDTINSATTVITANLAPPEHAAFAVVNNEATIGYSVTADAEHNEPAFYGKSNAQIAAASVVSSFQANQAFTASDGILEGGGRFGTELALVQVGFQT